jgi:hypothetical protein
VASDSKGNSTGFPKSRIIRSMTVRVRFATRLPVLLALLAALAAACGDPKANGTPDLRAHLVLQSGSAPIRIGQRIHASLILPKDSALATGTIYRASCTSLSFQVAPAIGWRDPWQDWYGAGIRKHATGTDGPLQCGVPGGTIGGPPPPPPQITFTLNEWLVFDRPGAYRISLTYRARFRNHGDVINDPNRRSRPCSMKMGLLPGSLWKF